MDMTTSNENILVRELSRNIVAEIAPHELPLFRAQSEAYFKDPHGTIERKAGKEEMLGFGVGSDTVFLTPAVLSIVTLVVNFIIVTVKDSLQVESKEFLNDAVKRMFNNIQPGYKKGQSTTESVSLTPEQLKQVRNLAISQALKLRLSEKTAETLANSLVGSLVVDASL
jgi:hypothetical protein